MYKNIYALCILLLLSGFSDSVEPMHRPSSKIKGITMVAPPKPFKINPIQPIKKVHANWVAIVPYGYSRENKPEVYYNAKWQWWGEKTQGATESIQLALKQGLKVMLKPQVYIHNSWVGNVDFDTEEEWLAWEKTYRDFILHFVQIAKEESVEMFCIGTEYKISVDKREKYWRKLIEEIRSGFGGQIVYSANWDSFQNVPIWDAVDYIGLSSYFPLTDKKTPHLKDLLKAWRPIVKKLRKFSQKKQKSIIFTEFGYLTVDGCADKAWVLEKNIEALQINQMAQANAIDALFTTFWNEDWWAGGFLWKWFPNMEGHEGYPEKDYTPQGKLSEQILASWYKRT